MQQRVIQQFGGFEPFAHFTHVYFLAVNETDNWIAWSHTDRTRVRRLSPEGLTSSECRQQGRGQGAPAATANYPRICLTLLRSGGSSPKVNSCAQTWPVLGRTTPATTSASWQARLNAASTCGRTLVLDSRRRATSTAATRHRLQPGLRRLIIRLCGAVYPFCLRSPPRTHLGDAHRPITQSYLQTLITLVLWASCVLWKSPTL